MQPLLHVIERSDETFLAPRRLSAGESHRQEHEAVARHAVFAQAAAGGVVVLTERKITLSEFLAAVEVANRSQHIAVMPAEDACNDTAGGEGLLFAGDGAVEYLNVAHGFGSF